MSGAFIASMAAGTGSTAQFIDVQYVGNGQDTASTRPTYTVPSFAKVGDTVLFYCLTNAMGQGSSPPGANWTDASGTLGGGDSVYVKRMGAAGDLTASTTASGGYLAFVVYRGAPSFAVVSGTGFARSQYHAGVTFFGSVTPSPATQRASLISNGDVRQAYVSDMIPPINYANGTNYNQYTAVEFRSQ